MASVGIFRSYLKTPFLILLVFEVSILFSSVYSAGYLWFYSNPERLSQIFPNLWTGASVIAIITPVSMLATGLYQGQIREGLPGILLRLAISFVGSAAIVALIFYLVPHFFLDRGVTASAFINPFL